MDEATKNTIVGNYNKSKEIYEQFLKDSSQDFKLSGIKLVY